MGHQIRRLRLHKNAAAAARAARGAELSGNVGLNSSPEEGAAGRGGRLGGRHGGGAGSVHAVAAGQVRRDERALVGAQQIEGK